jgi:hypothetical protein
MVSKHHNTKGRKGAATGTHQSSHGKSRPRQKGNFSDTTKLKPV